MANSNSTTRIDITDSETVIYFTDYKSLHRSMRDMSVFERLGSRMEDVSASQKEILTSLYATIDYSNREVFVGCAIDYESTSGMLPAAENLAFCSAEICEREPTKEEKSVYEDSFMDCPSPVYSITLPPLNAFRNPLEHSDFSQEISNRTESECISEKLAKKIETAKWRKTKVSYVGSRSNLEPEWNPNFESVNKDEVRGASRQQYHTATEIWQDLFTVSYREWFAARLFVTNRLEQKLESTDIVALELVANSDGEDYCQYCGKISNESDFLEIPDKLDRMKRVCESCAKTFSDFADETVNKAIDENAKENGGQRVFHSDFENQ